VTGGVENGFNKTGDVWSLQWRVEDKEAQQRLKVGGSFSPRHAAEKEDCLQTGSMQHAQWSALLNAILGSLLTRFAMSYKLVYPCVNKRVVEQHSEPCAQPRTSNTS
jgi:hypothetical protein